MFNVNNDTYKRITSRDIRNVFLLGGLAGMLVFIACYGVSILDVTNDAWLLSGEDITQHYIGWKLLSGFGMDLSDWPDSGNPVSADLLYYIFGFQSVAGYFL